MRGNQFGNVFCLTTFGESHGVAMGAVIDGCPAGVIWRPELLAQFLERRRPGKSALTSARNEPDQVQILSGVFEGKTLGTPIAMIIFNQDARSGDYAKPEMLTRRGHATDLWQEKYGHSDPRGSGRASGRETVSRILGGSVAQMMAQQLYPELQVIAFTESIGEFKMSAAQIDQAASALQRKPWSVDEFSLRCPNLELNAKMEQLLAQAKDSGESYGGTVLLHVAGVPKGLGQPVFRKLKSTLAAALFGVGAITALEVGEGFSSSHQTGKVFHNTEQNYGGIRGGISSGDPISLRVAFKPASSRAEVAKNGRHDPCIVPRAVPVLESMIWLDLADQILMSRLDRI